jgi:hypothetical protein
MLADERDYVVVGETAASGRAWAIEGTGSYGAGLARFLADHGETVLVSQACAICQSTRSAGVGDP